MKKIPQSILIFIATTLISCSSSPKPVPLEPLPPPNFNAKSFESENAIIRISSPAIQKSISCTSPIIQKRGALPIGQTSCTNTSFSSVQFEYKFEWFDNNGFHISTPNAWHTVFIEPGESTSLTTIGKSVTAKLFELTIRIPRNDF